ncbi:hypothetical protein ACP4OV_001971 [Aristida adscensionis]
MAPAPAMVSASTGAMNSVLSKLTTLLSLSEEYKLQKGMKTNLQLFHDELTNMKDLLEKLAEKEDHDPLVRGWMKQVREMTYDLDDGLDVFILSSAKPHVPSSAPGNRIKRIVKKASRVMSKGKSRHQIENLVQELKLRVQEASERRSRYKLDDAGNSSSSAVCIDPRLNAMYEDASSLVGMEGQREKLSELILDGQQKLKVVPIVGFAGLGKTTLATNVYRKIREQFNCAAFFSVSQKPDIKKILHAILHQVGVQAADDWELIDILREHLVDKRYFVVIDDVWSESTWKTIKNALPENDLGSRILVTTRKMSVAEPCCYPERDHIFQMRPLTDSEARALFFRRVFGSEDGCPPQFAQISNDILKKCGGVPLAIIAMATLLASRQYSAQEWEEIRDSIHSSLYKDTGMEETRRVLNLSYIDLPFHLKTCFLYISMFPEDYVIDRRRLIRRWIAEGFISGECVDLERVGEHYLKELISRSLVQPVGIQCDGRVDTCRVHDIILDLITYKSVEENFVTTYGGHEQISGLQDKIRRLSLPCRYRWDTFEPSEITTSHVRSLTIIGWKEEIPALENFRALRVLDVETSGELESKYFRNIGRLYLLKYLRLHTTSAIQLPEEIGELQCLETLDLNGAPECKCPKSIVRLKKLMYLLVRNVKLQEGFGSMRNLQEVSCVTIDSTSPANSLAELGDLSLLRTLRLKWCISVGDTDMNIYVDILVSSLRKLITSSLQSLCIQSDDGCSLDFLLNVLPSSGHNLRDFRMMSSYYCLPRVPDRLPSLVNLTFLRINIEVVRQEVLQILGEMPAVLALLLQVKSTDPKQGLIVKNSWFRSLKRFHLDRIGDSRVGMLTFEPGAMARLEELGFVFTAHEEFVAHGFHFGIEHLSSLKHVMVRINCREARANVVKSAEDAFRHAVDCHPRRPSLELRRLDEEHMINNERQIAVEDKEEQGRNEKDNDAEHEMVVEGTSTPPTES